MSHLKDWQTRSSDCTILRESVRWAECKSWDHFVDLKNRMAKEHIIYYYISGFKLELSINYFRNVLRSLFLYLQCKNLFWLHGPGTSLLFFTVYHFWSPYATTQLSYLSTCTSLPLKAKIKHTAPLVKAERQARMEISVPQGKGSKGK